MPFFWQLRHFEDLPPALRRLTFPPGGLMSAARTLPFPHGTAPNGGPATWCAPRHEASPSVRAPSPRVRSGEGCMPSAPLTCATPAVLGPTCRPKRESPSCIGSLAPSVLRHLSFDIHRVGRAQLGPWPSLATANARGCHLDYSAQEFHTKTQPPGMMARSTVWCPVSGVPAFKPLSSFKEF